MFVKAASRQGRAGIPEPAVTSKLKPLRPLPCEGRGRGVGGRRTWRAGAGPGRRSQRTGAQGLGPAWQSGVGESGGREARGGPQLAGLGLRPGAAAAPPPHPAEADVESTARAAAGGGGGAAARRRPALSGPRGARVAATAAARRGEAVEEAEAEAEEGGVHEAGPRLQEEAMNGDRTESDWQGLVSEVRPRRRPAGGAGPSGSPGPEPAPPGVAERGGDARGTRRPPPAPGEPLEPRLPG